MLDAGTKRDIDRVHEAVRAWRPDSPLVAAVFSHHHLDHVWATRRFDEEVFSCRSEHPTCHPESEAMALTRRRSQKNSGRARTRCGSCSPE